MNSSLNTNFNSLCPPLANVICPRFIIVVQCVWRWRKNIVNLQCNYCAFCKIINMLITCLDFWMFTTQHWWWKRNVEVVMNMFRVRLLSSANLQSVLWHFLKLHIARCFLSLNIVLSQFMMHMCVSMLHLDCWIKGC